jgi:hypothetical protein
MSDEELKTDRAAHETALREMRERITKAARNAEAKELPALADALLAIGRSLRHHQ